MDGFKSAGPMVLKSTCPVHGVVQFQKRYPHDWSWWCEKIDSDECDYIIWVQDFINSPDGGEPRRWVDLMAELDETIVKRKNDTLLQNSNA